MTASFSLELRGVRRAHVADQRRHLADRGQELREHRQQPVAEIGDPAALARRDRARARNLPLQPALVTSVRAAARWRRAIGCGTPSCVWPPRIASMPLTRDASFRSTSMPLCDSSTTACAPLPRASSTIFCSSSSWMPNVQSGTK